MPLPKRMKAELIERGDVEAHRFTPPGSGWVTLRVRDENARRRALEILRERYEHALSVRARGGRAPQPTA